VSAIIQVEALSKAYSYKLALKQVSFEVERSNPFVGILGHNGSGKSTLIKLLCGLSKPTHGRITIGGWSIPQELGAVRAQLGLVSHALMLSPMLTARENLRFYGRLYAVPALDERIEQPARNGRLNTFC
jgi:ABC-type multidrug transport system ATPase subunit